MKWENFDQNYAQIHSILDQAIRAAETKGNRFLTIRNGKLELTNHANKAVPFSTVAKFLENLPKEAGFDKLQNKLRVLQNVEGTTAVTQTAAFNVLKGNLAEKLTAGLDAEFQETLTPLIESAVDMIRQNGIKNGADIFYLVLGDNAKKGMEKAFEALLAQPRFSKEVESYFAKG